jgi:hypothetical protein
MIDKIHLAIQKIEQGRQYTYEIDNLDSIVWHDLDTKQPISKTDIQTKISEIEQQETDKQASAKSKLLALGLTEAEIKTIIG